MLAREFGEAEGERRERDDATLPSAEDGGEFLLEILHFLRGGASRQLAPAKAPELVDLPRAACPAGEVRLAGNQRSGQLEVIDRDTHLAIVFAPLSFDRFIRRRRCVLLRGVCRGVRLCGDLDTVVKQQEAYLHVCEMDAALLPELLLDSVQIHPLRSPTAQAFQLLFADFRAHALHHTTGKARVSNALGNAFDYVRCTIFDVRFGEFPRLRASLAKPDRERNCEGNVWM